MENIFNINNILEISPILSISFLILYVDFMRRRDSISIVCGNKREAYEIIILLFAFFYFLIIYIYN